MTFAEIEALPSSAARMAAYRAYVERDPNHPLAWFNLAVECEAARAYDDARSAAETLRRLDPTLVSMLPDRVRQLLPGNLAPSAIPDHDIGGYRITGVASATESQILYEAVRVTDQMPVTLRRMLDLSHTGARTTFELAVAVPRIEGIARAIGVIEDAERGPLLVLERIRGEPLRGDPRALLDAEVALRLIRSAARSIDALHRAGALHGDLRPESVVRDHSRNEEIEELPRASLFVSYRLGSDRRDGGMRLNDERPVFLSRAGYWCDESSTVITQAVHMP
jgi:serine/threonine protein kinase